MRASTFKVIATAAFAVTAAIPAASAADLAPRPYTKAPVMVDPGYNWSGFYIGGNVGYSWGRERTDGDLTGTQNVSVFRTAGPDLISSTTTAVAALPLSSRANMDGFIGGAQIGYNWQSGKWLFGVEADIQGSDERATADVCTAVGCPLGSSILTANYKLDWFGTARGPIVCCSTRPEVWLTAIWQRMRPWCL
jgi:outer membrane immunogenic protein